LPENESRQFLASFLRLTRVTNTGAAFSLGQGYAQTVTFISTVVFLILFFWSIRRYRSSTHSLLEELGMAMVIGAALGNLVDRYIYGRVTDFLEFEFVSFPVFNVADVLIDIGLVLAIISMMRRRAP